jgi:hypothetical protein
VWTNRPIRPGRRLRCRPNHRDGHLAGDPHATRSPAGHHHRGQARDALAGTAAAAPAAWNEITGAGDIDADPDQVGTDDLATSEILRQAMPATVFTAGDNQYPWGQIEDYQDPNGYSGTWGRQPLKAITCAAVGNHEYLDPRTGPAGFLDYFSPNCPHRPDVEYAGTSGGAVLPTAYAFRPTPGSGWWAYVLDSQCTHHDSPRTEFGPSCGRTGNMLNWFRAHMAAHPARCRLAIWHHPRWISGNSQADEDARVYELYNFTAPARTGTRFRMASHHGVLRVRLDPGRWVSEFDSTDGTVLDRASASC